MQYGEVYLTVLSLTDYGSKNSFVYTNFVLKDKNNTVLGVGKMVGGEVLFDNLKVTLPVGDTTLFVYAQVTDITPTTSLPVYLSLGINDQYDVNLVTKSTAKGFYPNIDESKNGADYQIKVVNY